MPEKRTDEYCEIHLIGIYYYIAAADSMASCGNESHLLKTSGWENRKRSEKRWNLKLILKAKLPAGG